MTVPINQHGLSILAIKASEHNSKHEELWLSCTTKHIKISKVSSTVLLSTLVHKFTMNPKNEMTFPRMYLIQSVPAAWKTCGKMQFSKLLMYCSNYTVFHSPAQLDPAALTFLSLNIWFQQMFIAILFAVLLVLPACLPKLHASA